jgi:hypothetical protein
MSSAQELVKSAEIARFLETHQGAADAVQRAAKELAEKSDAPAALKKLLPALSSKVVKVFFSYKKKDEPAAKVVVDVLRESSAEKLDITFQGEFTQEISGMHWRQQIRESVRQANWFILLLPDPSEELDWCLYETGLFEAQLTTADRLICLHHPDTEIPSPIEGYQAVAATVPEMEKFLRMVYIEEGPIAGLPPINRAIEKRIPELAGRVVEAIRAPKRKLHRDVFEPWIEFRLEEAGALNDKEDLDTATIVNANKEALDLFGFRQIKGTFGELRSTILEGQGDSRWREELFHVIRKIAQGRTFHSVQAVFQSADGRIYRPVALAVDRSGPEGPVQTYHLTFAEEVTAADTAVMPTELTTLVTLLRFTFRFRWEVLERFSKGPLSAEDVERLDVNLTRITVDWESRGAIAGADILALFPGDQARRVQEMTEAWHRLRNPAKTGDLDIAIEKKDGKRIPSLLASILPMNQEFLEMAADRFAQMIGGAKRRSVE